jgi:hypothetical protein
MTKLEEVATAMRDKDLEQGHCDPGTAVTSYLPTARAAVEALREPSEATKECMVGAGWHGNIEGCRNEEIECGTDRRHPQRANQGD